MIPYFTFCVVSSRPGLLPVQYLVDLCIITLNVKFNEKLTFLRSLYVCLLFYSYSFSDLIELKLKLLGIVRNFNELISKLTGDLRCHLKLNTLTRITR